MPAMQAAVNAYRPHQIMFGTDYPMEIHTGKDKKWFIDNIKACPCRDKDDFQQLQPGLRAKRIARTGNSPFAISATWRQAHPIPSNFCTISYSLVIIF
jgi:hypothetical protein